MSIKMLFPFLKKKNYYYYYLRGRNYYYYLRGRNFHAINTVMFFYGFTISNNIGGKCFLPFY